MNIKKEFKKSKNYYLKHINSDTYKKEKLVYDATRKKDYDDFLKRNHKSQNRPDNYDNYSITHISICDVLSNDGVTKLLKNLYSLPKKGYSKEIIYRKPTLFKRYDYIHLLYSHSFQGKFADIRFKDDKYIDFINITWSQINSFYAVLEYDFKLKKSLSPDDCTKFICENIHLLNSKDLLTYYNIDYKNGLNIHAIEEMDNDYFVLIFQHYITSLFYSEQGRTTKLPTMVYMTRPEPININTLNIDHFFVSYFNKKDNYVIASGFHDDYILLAGNNQIPYFNLIQYISEYGNNFYYMFFGYNELKQLEINFSKYSTGRKKIKYDKSFIAMLNKAQSLLETRQTTKSDIFKAFNKNWELYYGGEKKNFNKEMTRTNINYKEIYANTYSYLTALSNINYTKSNILISVIALIIAIVSLIMTI